ncbi:unnamed protein product [Thlaspi arvense]|uniref:Uncharacterized protein n=1 Tax=Thlaspi arvense TaxID=13288 RepID=A0AAU9RX37_THLAR|nr:unnamed protein product [Thlaspi arvense]
MEKMLYFMHAGRLVFAFALVVSAWREYNLEGTWRVFSLNGEVAAEEYKVGLGIMMKAKYIIGLGILIKLFGGIFFIFSTYLGALLLYITQVKCMNKNVNGTSSTDNHDLAAMCYYDSIAQEEWRQIFCDQLNETLRLASSNPLFIQSKFNTIFMPFIKRVGVVAVLVFFIAMEHKYRMLKKHKTN